MSWQEQINQRLSFIYKDGISSQQREEILNMVASKIPSESPVKEELWSEKDVLLITYGDSLLEENELPLNTLRKFLKNHLEGYINAVHILPFFPFSSDDGFSVIDFWQVDPKLGTWKEVNAIAKQNKLMADLVINHASAQGEWFQNYLKGEGEGADFFIEADPALDLSKVVRPRNLPLLTPVDTAKGKRYVWTTFSEDQIDLNFANPRVLKTMLEVLLTYIQHGARIIRLDAIAFLWKEIGSSCLHLPETHEAVKLMRDVAQLVDPGAIIITETNVPNKENLSYFGAGDEAHMVYQFSLPPLLLHALNSGNGHYLTEWASSLPELAGDCTYFNFTSSHDGIGVRPLEGLLPEEEKTPLFEDIKAAGGHISMKANSDGSASPYELNITYYDALKRARGKGEDGLQDERFICSQLINLAMKGMPTFYIHSLLASHNYSAGVEETGRARTINREKLAYAELEKEIQHPASRRGKIFQNLLQAIKVRTYMPAFHPSAYQKICDMGPKLFCILRTADAGRILAISNLSGEVVEHCLKEKFEDLCYDLLSANTLNPQKLKLKPYQTVWLSTK